MQGQTSKKIKTNKLQQRLRRNMTPAERTLWQVLRYHQMCGAKFRRQHRFGDYILDFVCIEKKVVIEVDGGQHALQKEYDERRAQFLLDAGFRTIRFWNHEVINSIEAVQEKIFVTLEKTGPHPHPYPPLEGEGVRLK